MKKVTAFSLAENIYLLKKDVGGIKEMTVLMELICHLAVLLIPLCIVHFAVVTVIKDMEDLRK